MPQQQVLDGNYKPIPGSVQQYDPIGGQYVAVQAAPTKTATDSTVYAPSVTVLNDGYKASYSSSITGLVTAASATDIFTITGSATKTIRITRIEVSGIATTAIDTSVVLIMRSTANSGGTSSTPSIAPYDSTSAAATAVVRAYTVNPASLGTAVGSIRSSKVLFNLVSPAAGSEAGRLIEDFGDRPTQAVVLRGTAQSLCVNLNGVTVAGPSIDVSVEFTEE